MCAYGFSVSSMLSLLLGAALHGSRTTPGWTPRCSPPGCTTELICMVFPTSRKDSSVEIPRIYFWPLFSKFFIYVVSSNSGLSRFASELRKRVRTSHSHVYTFSRAWSTTKARFTTGWPFAFLHSLRRLAEARNSDCLILRSA
ncbi:hypothetical protein BDV96DRAFT_108339 [Lophiotrema nucula]|uniref:Secreted protein n=1 Tax=Lophiotrema nucula TaxID=690887 RepID=A0A6A5Z3M4_9PLEO|nr:hypothetical protein BDV96DRAFT_108339 [Lophiotrema nucula]